MLCIGDIVREASAKLLGRTLKSNCKVEVNAVSVRVFRPSDDGHELAMRLNANAKSATAKIAIFRGSKPDYFEIPFADPKLFPKIIKHAKEAVKWKGRQV